MAFDRQKQFLANLFAGPFPGHGLIVNPVWPDSPLGDFLCSDRPVRDWFPFYEARYEAMIRQTEALGDDSVPYVPLNTNTGIFASAFGCRLHVYKEGGTNACALHAVETGAEADALPQPDPLGAPLLARFMDLAHGLRNRLGPDAAIGVPDIQSPFDIAALIWKKEELLVALYENPDAVKRLVAKCHRLLEDFLDQFLQAFPDGNLCHCPTAWAPPRQGMWLSEDEAGALSVPMFEEFCLPSLEALSRRYGGLFMHCCAAADHLYASFRKIPDLRGLNRVFQAPGPAPAIETFSGHTVLIQAWLGESDIRSFLSMAKPETRFLFNIGSMTPDAARPVLDRLRPACGR